MKRHTSLHLGAILGGISNHGDTGSTHIQADTDHHGAALSGHTALVEIDTIV